jgi:4-hydroxy-4-methyl-2-oxoglutarate aldolase
MAPRRHAAPAGLRGLSTANLADAVVRLGLPVRLAPFEVKPLVPGSRAFGPVRPVQHVGSVDVFLDALGHAKAGDVIVIDNRGRTREGAIGDQIVREFKQAGIAGVVLWGAHRDTEELLEIGLPVFSLGGFALGPVKAGKRPKTALSKARIGKPWVDARDYAAADDDGVIFLDGRRLGAIAETAVAIRRRETAQAARQNKGDSLRQQFRFADYLARRKKDPRLSFRKYLRQIKGAIEE